MRRPRTLWINVALGVALVAAGTAAYFSIRDPGTPTTTATRTTTVSRGTVTASVTGTGNVASASTVGVNFTSGGTLTAVDVKVGDVVAKGQKLATIDPVSLDNALSTAKAQLASAQAGYDTTAAGETALQKQKDSLSIQSAQLSVNNASTALSSARSQLANDTTAQNKAVSDAQAALKAGTGTQAQVDTATATRTSTLQKDNQAITSAQQQVSSAQNQLAQQQLTATTDAQGSTAAQLAQAKASLLSAQLAVSTAESNVAGATLTAPQAGTVVSVGGTVGQTVSGGSSGSSASSSGSSGSGSSGSGSSGSSASTSSTGSSSSTSGSTTGFVVLSDLTKLTVTANIAEADAAAIKVGQSATVTLSATNTTAQGTVTSIAVQSITSNNVVQYPVTISLTDVPAGVRLGASASIAITTGSADNVLIAPSSAVTTLGRRHTVTVLTNGVRTVTPVQVGLVGDSGTEITSGVSEGDVLVLPTSTASTSTTGFPRLGGIGAGIGGARG